MEADANRGSGANGSEGGAKEVAEVGAEVFAGVVIELDTQDDEEKGDSQLKVLLERRLKACIVVSDWETECTVKGETVMKRNDQGNYIEGKSSTRSRETVFSKMRSK